MTIIGGFVLICISLAGVVCVCLLSIHLNKNKEYDGFDERQAIAQGKAYRLAFLMLQFYFLGVLIVDMAAGLDWICIQLVVLIGFLVGMLTFDTYCMLTGASLPIGKNPLASALTSGGLAVLWFVQFFGYLDGQTYVPMTGMGAAHWLRLFLGVTFGYRTLGYLIQYLREKRE